MAPMIFGYRCHRRSAYPKATLSTVLARLNPRRASLDERTRLLESKAGQPRGSVRQASANLPKDGKELGWSQRWVRTIPRSLLSAFAVFSFLFRQAASSANVESPTNSFNR